MTHFKNKRVLISGGSSGIGLSMAFEVVKAGGYVTIAGRTAASLDRAVAELNSVAPGRASSLTLDVNDKKSFLPEAPLSQLAESIDVMIHSAGLGGAAEIENTSMDRFETVMNTNFFGAVYLTKAVLDPMKKRGSGHICFVSSVAGKIGIYGFTAYASSKFALDGLAQSLRNELASTNIKVSVIYPPDTDTPMLAQENLSKPQVTKELSDGVLYSAEFVAQQSIKGMSLGKFEIYPGRKNFLQCQVIRMFPGIARRYVDWKVRQIQGSS